MSLRAARLCGIALLFAVGLLAVLLAAGVFAPSGVGAHVPDTDDDDMCDDSHVDFQRSPADCDDDGHQPIHRNVIEVDGGRDQELEFRAFVPGIAGLSPTEEIGIDLSGFDLSNVDFNTIADSIEISWSGVTETAAGVTLASPPRAEGMLFLHPSAEFSHLTVVPGQHLVVKIKAGSGIRTPELPRGFDNVTDGYLIPITFNGRDSPTDENIVVVNNPVSSTVPGATVRVELATYAEVSITSPEEITVDFSGPSEDSQFSIPTTITDTRITIRSAPSGETTSTFSPSDVLVQGAKVTLTIPETKTVAKGDYTISFSQLARIKNPFAAGNRIITVSSFVPGDEEDEITAVIRRTTTISPLEGPRGSEFTLQGKGYAQGTVTVFEADADEIKAEIEPEEENVLDPPVIGSGETLASVKTSRGSFTVKLKARGDSGQPIYKVWTRDSNGAIHFAVFDIKSSMFFEPATVGIGDTLKIIIVDWEDEDGHPQEVAAVQIGGVDAYTAAPIVYANCFDLDQDEVHEPDGKRAISFDVTVPVGVPPGEQTVAVYGHEQLEAIDGDDMSIIESSEPCADLTEGTWGNLVPDSIAKTRVIDDPNPLVAETVEIVAQALTVTPASAVRGQKVAIRGSGFTQRTEDDPCPNLRSKDDICSITIDGKDVAEEPSQFEVSHDGTVAFTVTVPPDVRAGENEVQVTGWDNTLGTGTLTVPEPFITVDPPQGQRGERVTVTGSGFAANGVFLVSYGDGGDLGVGDETVGAGQSDARGNFEVSFRVPLDADIGRTYRVSAFMEYEDGETSLRFEAGADHSPPAATVTISPDLVSPGDRMTILGENLPPFALVRPVQFANRDFTPVPNKSTSRNGTFEMEIVLQGVEPGDHQLRVEVSGVVITQVVQVALPPLSGPPKHVFKELINAGVLLRIWFFDRATQTWSFFDPSPEFLEFSNLTTVNSDDILWLHLSGPFEFQEDMLVEGWNHIALK